MTTGCAGVAKAAAAVPQRCRRLGLGMTLFSGILPQDYQNSLACEFESSLGPRFARDPAHSYMEFLSGCTNVLSYGFQSLDTIKHIQSTSCSICVTPVRSLEFQKINGRYKIRSLRIHVYERTRVMIKRSLTNSNESPTQGGNTQVTASFTEKSRIRTKTN